MLQRIYQEHIPWLTSCLFHRHAGWDVLSLILISHLFTEGRRNGWPVKQLVNSTSFV
jgi:hypothetical protein